MRIYISIGLLVVFLSTFSSCSVAMAAKKEGTSISKVQQCKNRSQFIASGGKIISSERNSKGELTEVYQYKQEKGSTARAIMHGVLDISTFGIWEAIGTPIEGMQSNEYFCIRVIYDNQDNVKSVLLN